MSIEQIIEALNEFKPFSEDDLENDNRRFLSSLMDNQKSNPDYLKAIPAIFHLIERYPHADLGTPGPLVHALESKAGNYYLGELFNSLNRIPTQLTFWMYNRVVNTEQVQSIRKDHIERMKQYSRHPLIDEETKNVAIEFIEYQENIH